MIIYCVFLTDLNECSPNPCRNGGICLDGDGDFTCECPSGWTGKQSNASKQYAKKKIKQIL